MSEIHGALRVLGPGDHLGELAVGLLVALLLSFGLGVGIGFTMGSGASPRG